MFSNLLVGPPATTSLPNLLRCSLRCAARPSRVLEPSNTSTASTQARFSACHSIRSELPPVRKTTTPSPNPLLVSVRPARVATPSSARHQPFRACGGSPHREPPVRAVALTPAGKPRWSHDSLNGTARARRSTTPLARSLRVDPSIRAGPTAPPWTRAHTGSGHSHRSTARSASLTPLDALPGDGLARGS